jgi:hypothetical protein
VRVLYIEYRIACTGNTTADATKPVAWRTLIPSGIPGRMGCTVKASPTLLNLNTTDINATADQNSAIAGTRPRQSPSPANPIPEVFHSTWTVCRGVHQTRYRRQCGVDTHPRQSDRTDPDRPQYTRSKQVTQETGSRPSARSQTTHLSRVGKVGLAHFENLVSWPTFI